jgi:hypothetical protein
MAALPIAPNPGERLFTEPTPAVRPWSRERVFMPRSRPSPEARFAMMSARVFDIADHR